MTLLGFKDRFVPNVEAGYRERKGLLAAGAPTPKRHSIRRTHKDGRAPAKVGVPIQLYARVRQKDMHKIVDVDPVCTKVDGIDIRKISGFYEVLVNANRLSQEQIGALAVSDGFKSIDAFFDFFDTGDHPVDVFSGHIIHWDWR